jgi:integrase
MPVDTRSARALAARRADLFVVDRIDHETGRLGGVLAGARRSFAMEAMNPALRRVTVRETDGGLEALAVFVGHGGQMLGPSSWDRIRLDAWRRMQRHAVEDPGAPILPPRPWRFHDLRHSFCLQLLKYLMRLTIVREARQPRGLPSLPEHVAFNPLLVVQRRMGHASPATTYLYLRYLEDPLNYVDEAFRQWAQHEDAGYADIAAHALQAGNAAQG